MSDSFNGELLHIFVVSILDAAILSWIALSWYRRSVLRLMAAPAGALPAEDTDSPPLHPAAGTMPVPGFIERPVRPGDRTLPALPPGWRRLAVAYLIGTLVYSLVMTVAHTVEFWPVSPGGIAALLWANVWPIVPILGALLLLKWAQTLRLGGLFILCGSIGVSLVTLAGQVVSREFNSAPLTNIYWANRQLIQMAYMPAIVLLLIGWRRIRGAIAMTVAAMLPFGLALLAFRRIFARMFESEASKRAVLQLAAWTSTDVAYYFIYMLLAVPVGLVVWLVLRRLGAAYERKRFSDIQLVVDCWFAIVAMAAIALQLTGPFGFSGIAVGIAAFVGYRGGVEMILRAWPVAADADTTTASGRLLLLRVFGHQARTERVFDHIAQHWRFRGPVQLIAGSDLAMRTVDPGDVLAFVTGRLRSQYVASAGEIPSRIARLDMRPDPDGRFRVNELYCLHDTWKATLQSLLAATDIVVMDLRGFSRESRGCLYELQQIVTRIATEGIVLIVDRATDRPLLEATLGLAWAEAKTAGSAAISAQPITLVTVERSSARELDAVMEQLRRRGAPS